MKRVYTNQEKLAYYRNQIDYASRRIEQIEKEEIRKWVKELMAERQNQKLKKGPLSGPFFLN